MGRSAPGRAREQLERGHRVDGSARVGEEAMADALVEVVGTLSRPCACPVWVAALVGLFFLTSCSRPCEGYFVGESDTAPVIAEDWPYGSGTAAGVWEVSLFPAAYGTNCVDVDAGDYPAEHYAYTLEFVNGDEGEQVNIYLDGVLFATGTYSDETAEGVPDRLEYQTGVRVADDRPGGTLTYIISGTAELEPNKSAGSLTWYGDEYIIVQDSRDPEVTPDCTFRYEVSGYKVCDE